MLLLLLLVQSCWWWWCWWWCWWCCCCCWCCCGSPDFRANIPRCSGHAFTIGESGEVEKSTGGC